MDLFRKYLLSTGATFAAPDGPNPGGGEDPEGGADEQLELQDDDDGPDDTPGEDGDDPEDAGDDPDDVAARGTDDAGEAGDKLRQQSRGNRQMGELRRQGRERADENARLTRELAEMRGRMDVLQNQQRPPQETAQQRADRMALLSPEERAMEMVNETLQRHDQNQRALNAQLLEQSDRADFSSRCASNPLFKKLETAVERRRNEMVQREGNAPARWVIATYLLGERILAQQTPGKKGATTRRQQQEARPVRSGGDVAAPRQRRGAAAPGSVEDFEARFGDVLI